MFVLWHGHKTIIQENIMSPAILDSNQCYKGGFLTRVFICDTDSYTSLKSYALLYVLKHGTQLVVC